MSQAEATIQNRRRITSTDIQEFLLRGRAFIALIVLIIVFSLLSDTFLKPANFVIMAKHVAQNAILGIGMTFVILTGGIDLSVGSVVGLAAMIAGGLINEGLVLPMFGVIVYYQVWAVLLITLVVGLVIGSINGIIITRFGVAPFIATLGMLYAARGLALLRSDGNTFPNLVGRPELGNTGFPELGAGNLLGINYSIWIMVVLAIIAYVVTTRTPFGRQIYAIGGNERAAELSGVRVKRVKTIVYMISGFCSAIVGLVIASQLVAAHPATGTFFELNAIAAVVLGGTSLSGGRGSIGGTIIGAFVIGVLNDGMIGLGISAFWQQVIKGAVIVFAVIVDQAQVRWQERVALQQQQQQQQVA